MKKTELLVVQLEEASALLDRKTDAHFRLSLILTDNVAELLFRQEAGRHLQFMDTRREFLKNAELNRVQTMSTDFGDLIERAKREVVTTERQAKIESDFGARLGYLTEMQAISSGEARVFGKLHQYRNDTYHREKFRERTVATAARLYFDLTCSLLGRFTPTLSMLISKEDAENRYPNLTKYFDDGETSWMTQTSFAERLARKLAPAERKVGEALADHMVARIDQMTKTAEEPLQLLDEEWTVEDVFRLVQITDHVAPFVEDVRKKRVKYRYEHIGKWRARAERLGNCTDRVESFQRFAQLEDEIEPIEEALEEFALAVDREIQLLVDQARGK